MTTWVRATIAAANPPDLDLSHHPAPALVPSVGLGIHNADGNPVDTCTAGWLVHDSTGQAGLLTAGHCDDGGTATPVGITIRAADSGGTIAELIGPWLKRWDLSIDSS
jgi:hypothetical protein